MYTDIEILSVGVLVSLVSALIRSREFGIRVFNQREVYFCYRYGDNTLN